MQEGAREVRVLAAEDEQVRRSAIRVQPHFSLAMELSSQLQLSWARAAFGGRALIARRGKGIEGQNLVRERRA
jgi:hypothetical protein